MGGTRGAVAPLFHFVLSESVFVRIWCILALNYAAGGNNLNDFY